MIGEQLKLDIHCGFECVHQVPVFISIANTHIGLHSKLKPRKVGQ